MEDYSIQHKKAWEFDAYDFWVKTAGKPEERASKDRENPKKMLNSSDLSSSQWFANSVQRKAGV